MRTEFELAAIDPRFASVLSDLTPLARTPGPDARLFTAASAGGRRVAVVPIHGSLTPGYGRTLSATGYGSIIEEVSAAAADGGIEAITRAIDSPGGRVDGLLPAAAAIRAAARVKPVTAEIGSYGCSAAYALGSQANRILLRDDLGMVGSIGVILIHLDLSGALAQAGVKPTIITSAALKADAHFLRPLTTESRARLQAEIDNADQIVKRVIAEARPSLTIDAMNAMQAGVFVGLDARTGRRPALDHRLVDLVGKVGLAAGAGSPAAESTSWSAAIARANAETEAARGPGVTSPQFGWGGGF